MKTFKTAISLVPVLLLIVSVTGLAGADRTAKLSFTLDDSTVMKVWVSADRQVEIDRKKHGWDEHISYEFYLNPKPDDEQRPGRYLSGMFSGGGGSAYSIDGFVNEEVTPDTQEVRQKYMEFLPPVAAQEISSLLMPFYRHDPMAMLQRLAEIVRDPLDDPDSLKRTDKPKYMPKRHRVRFAFPMPPGTEGQADLIGITVERIAELFPDRTVAAGESWLVNNESFEGIPLNECTEITVKDISDGIVTLGIKSSACRRHSPIPLEYSGVSMSIEFEATQTGTLKIVEETGAVDDGRLEQKIESTLRVESAPGLTTPLETPFTLSAQFKVEMKKDPYSRVTKAGISRN